MGTKRKPEGNHKHANFNPLVLFVYVRLVYKLDDIPKGIIHMLKFLTFKGFVWNASLRFEVCSRGVVEGECWNMKLIAGKWRRLSSMNECSPLLQCTMHGFVGGGRFHWVPLHRLHCTFVQCTLNIIHCSCISCTCCTNYTADITLHIAHWNPVDDIGSHSDRDISVYS